MIFNYSVRDEKGKLSTGQIETATREAAVSALQARGYYILSLEGLEKENWYDPILNFFNRVKRKDLVIFTREFAALLEAHIPIDKAINSLSKQVENPILRDVLGVVASDIQGGLSLSQSLAKFPNIFGEFYVNMIRASEISGRVEQTVAYLADYLERDWALSKKVMNALIYPIFVIVIFLIVVVIATIVVIPKLSQIFQESNVSLPWMTKALIGLGNLIIYWGWGILILSLILLFLFWRYTKTEEGRATFDEFKLRVPIVGGVLKKVYIARFSESAAVLIRGGISMPTSLEMAGKVASNYVYKQIAFEVAEGVRRGETVSSILKEYPEEFPPLVNQMIQVGESSGRVDDLLEKVSSFYKQEIELGLSAMTEMLQPILIIILAIFVGFLVASILFPIYNLVQSM